MARKREAGHRTCGGKLEQEIYGEKLLREGDLDRLTMATAGGGR